MHSSRMRWEGEGGSVCPGGGGVCPGGGGVCPGGGGVCPGGGGVCPGGGGVCPGGGGGCLPRRGVSAQGGVFGRHLLCEQNDRRL